MTSTNKPDYWSLLGLPPGSDSDQLKRAFRREARKWHPDLNGNNPDAEERFKLVNEAYVVLSDLRKRQLWEEDHSISCKSEELYADGFPEFEEYLEQILGITTHNDSQEEDEHYINYKGDWPTTSQSTPPLVEVSEDLESLVELTPDQAVNGTSIELQLPDGTLVEIQTPPFAGDGWRLRLAGVAKGGRDHFLQLRVQTEEGLRIDGLRVFYRLELFPPEAVLGCAVDIPTLNGPVTLQVPPRSSSGRLLRLRGRGIEFDGNRGDQLVEIVIVIPDEIGDSENALYKRLLELSLDYG